MAVTAFDTHRIVKRLKEAGFNEAQAETFTEVLQESRAFDLADLATKADLAVLRSDLAGVRAELKSDIADVRAELKADLADVRTELKSDIADVRAELKADIAVLRVEIERSKNDVLKWVVPLILAQIAINVGVLAKLLS